MCCAWIAEGLAQAGYIFEDGRTEELVRRWSGAAPEACLVSKSIAYLRRTGQVEDLEFILRHVNDLSAVFMLERDEVVLVRMAE